MTHYHTPVLLKESVDGLNIKPNGVYVDVTFGGGGHSREILQRLDKGKLIAFDQDQAATANLIKDDRFIFVPHNFQYMRNFLRHLEIEKVDGILADLGVSSHHFDEADRGFSFRFEDASLDMRMNKQSTLTAKDIINTYEYESLARMFRLYGDVENAGKLAKQICNGRITKKVESVSSFLGLIEPLIQKKHENKYLAKVFQAIRMEVNKEEAVLLEMLSQTTELIAPEGRLVVISYHSVEDRLVKNFIRTGNFEGEQNKDFYGNLIAPFKPVVNKVIVPTEEEIAENGRARSAKLRIAERV